MLASLLSLLAPTVVACAPSSERTPLGQARGDSGDTLEVYYRGQKVSVERQGDTLLFEGDIEVMPGDLWGGPDDEEHGAVAAERRDGIGVVSQAVKIRGYRYRWPAGANGTFVIPYAWAGPVVDVNGDGMVNSSDDFSATQRTHIIKAMTDWSRAVGALVFREKVAGDTGYISYRRALGDVCTSALGYLGTAQSINLVDGCVSATGFSTQHEIGHALGLYHQHTRKDRNSFVTVNWANLEGCLPDAGVGGNAVPSACGPTACAPNPQACGCDPDAGLSSCNRAGQYSTNSSRSDIGAYDFDSVMHYGAFYFAKTLSVDGGPTMPQPTLTAVSGSPAMGQTNHLSLGDVAAVSAMYPSIRLHDFHFASTGSQPLCTLSSREDDVAVGYTVTSTLPPSQISGPSLSTDGLAEGSYTASCKAKSVFWDQNYNYPNSTATFDLAGYDQTKVEVYDTGAAVALQVVNPGLIAVLFN